MRRDPVEVLDLEDRGPHAMRVRVVERARVAKEHAERVTVVRQVRDAEEMLRVDRTLQRLPRRAEQLERRVDALQHVVRGRRERHVGRLASARRTDGRRILHPREARERRARCRGRCARTARRDGGRRGRVCGARLPGLVRARGHLPRVGSVRVPALDAPLGACACAYTLNGRPWIVGPGTFVARGVRTAARAPVGVNRIKVESIAGRTTPASHLMDRSRMDPHPSLGRRELPFTQTGIRKLRNGPVAPSTGHDIEERPVISGRADERHRDRGPREGVPASAPRDRARGRRIGPRGPRGRGVRLPRSERRRQDDHDPLPPRAGASLIRAGLDARPGCPSSAPRRDRTRGKHRRDAGALPSVQRPAEPPDPGPAAGDRAVADRRIARSGRSVRAPPTTPSGPTRWG